MYHDKLFLVASGIGITPALEVSHFTDPVKYM
jgi:ferredoxin-NADP reductase